LGALEPGEVANVPTKDNDRVLLKDPQVGDCGKGGNFLLNFALTLPRLHRVV